MVNINFLLFIMLFCNTVSPGDWGKKQNTGSAEDRITAVLRRKRPNIKLNISATIIDNQKCQHKVEDLLVDENQLYFVGKRGVAWCKLELAKLESITVAKSQENGGGKVLVTESESETPLLKIIVKEKNKDDLTEYLVHPNILFSGKSQGSEIAEGLCLNKLEKITINNVEKVDNDDKKLSKKLQKKIDSIDRKESLEEKDTETSMLMRLFGFGKVQQSSFDDKSKINKINKKKPDTKNGKAAPQDSLHSNWLNFKAQTEVNNKTKPVIKPLIVKNRKNKKSKPLAKQQKPFKYLVFADLPEDKSESSCIVCSKSFLETKDKPKKQQIIVTPCDHYFHKKCLKKWLKESDHQNCPKCRHSLEGLTIQDSPKMTTKKIKNRDNASDKDQDSDDEDQDSDDEDKNSDDEDQD